MSASGGTCPPEGGTLASDSSVAPEGRMKLGDLVARVKREPLAKADAAPDAALGPHDETGGEAPGARQAAETAHRAGQVWR